ncbi:MAG: FdtA/QdtA family cupin domain-containing protein [Muribaculaceae bacterium]|nr:FdtA/QdtA family cupin domain-containing protein [Muribaculaceae bacterium]
MSPLDNVRILEFPGVADPARGVLTVAEHIHFDRTLPSGVAETYLFPINRVFYIHGIPPGGRRGGHAHKSNCEILICINGAFDLTLSDGFRQQTYHLNDPTKGIVIPPDAWTRMENFSPDTILMVLCSEEYSEEGYIHDFSAYKTYISQHYGLS